ncbi:hypothetical protein PCK2_000129, partial [Pneumocystis canis]
MSSSASIYEQQNNLRLEELVKISNLLNLFKLISFSKESKISILKDISIDIHKQASDMTMLDQGVNKFEYDDLSLTGIERSNITALQECSKIRATFKSCYF